MAQPLQPPRGTHKRYHVLIPAKQAEKINKVLAKRGIRPAEILRKALLDLLG